MRGLARINRNITGEEILSKFKIHISEGWSATSFHGRMGVGQGMMRQWLNRFPSFAEEFSKAKEKERLVSFHGNKLGPKGSGISKGGYMDLKRLSDVVEKSFEHYKLASDRATWDGDIFKDLHWKLRAGFRAGRYLKLRRKLESLGGRFRNNPPLKLK